MNYIRYTFLIILLSISAITSAQDGYIRGTIIDDDNAEPLFAANAGVTGTTIGASADFDGNFELKVAQGTYTISISFIGYQNLNITDVVVKAGQVTNLNTIRLKSSAIAVDVVTVTAEATRNTETALLTIKKKSVNVIDGISSQNFKKMGDGNAAVAVTRVPGVSVQGGKYVYVRGLGDRYTKTTFNGLDIPGLDPDRNSLQMDIFPTNIVDNIIVSKSFTADLPADFSGGVVDINIKSFPESKSLKSSVGMSYNKNVDLNGNFLTFYGGESDFLAFDDGGRDFPLSGIEQDVQTFTDPKFNPETFPNTLKFNPQMSTVRGNTYFSKNQFFKAFNKLSGGEMNFNGINFSISGGNQQTINEKTYGYNGAISYKNTFSFYENSIQNSFEKSSDKSINELFISRSQRGDVGKNNALLSAMVGGAMKFDNAKYKVNILHLQNAEKKAGLFTVDNFESNFNTVKKENLDFSERSISNIIISGTHNYPEKKQKVEWKLSPTYSKIRDKDVRESAYEIEINGNDTSFLFSPSGAGYPSRLWRNLDEYNVAARVDVTKEHELFDRTSKLKYGLGFTYKERSYEILRYLIKPSGLYGIFTYSGNPDELLTDFLYDPTAESGFYLAGEYQASNTYEGVQTNLSLYVSEEIDVTDQIKGILGIRVESYDQYYTGINQDKTRKYDNELVFSDYTSPTLIDMDSIPFGIYPTISAIYTIDKNSNLRGSIFRTTARPSFKEKSNAQILDVLSGITFNGNIDLIASTIHNYDLRYETYGKKGETFAVSGFLKNLYNPIEIVSYTADEDNIQPINSGNAQLMGVEVEGRKNLDNVADGLSLNVNASYITSEVKIVGDEYESRLNNLREGEEFVETREMQGQAPYLINGGLSYKNPNGKIEGGLFFNVQGPTLSIVGINKRPDIYTSPFNSLNLNLIYKFSEQSQFSLSVKNILNEEKELVTQSFGTDSEIYSSYKLGRSIGFKWTYSMF